MLLFGLVTGAGMLCKIHSVFLWSGMGLYILLYQRSWLRSGSLYASAGITLLLFMPVIGWNIQHDFITFRYHGERVDVSGGGLRPDYFAAFTAGQILYTNPLVFILLVQAMRRYPLKADNRYRILLLTAMPLILLATAVSFFRELLPHWTGPGFVTLMIPAGIYLAQRQAAPAGKPPGLPALSRAALLLTLVVVLAGTLLIRYYPGTMGKQENDRLGYGDFTLDMHGWKAFAPVFDSIYRSTHPVPVTGGTLLLADEWFPAAHIDYYLARPLGIRMLVSGPVEKTHQYQWLNRQRGPLPHRADVYIISPSNSPVHPENISWLNKVQPIRSDTILQYRSGKPARRFAVHHYPEMNIPLR
jgi:hypothetical protein